MSIAFTPPQRSTPVNPDITIPQVEDIHRIQADPRFASIELVPVSTLADALRAALGSVVDSAARGKKKRRSKKGFPKVVAREFDDSGEEEQWREDEDGFREG